MKGILFRTEMIRAIIKGRKTVTRRVLNPQPSDEESLECGYFTPALEDKNGEQYPADYEVFGAYTSDGEYSWKPRYIPGEVVYVKEAFCPVCFKADGIKDACYKTDDDFTEASIHCQKLKWQSPMFMLEWAARYFIRIKSVRPERLQEITEEDAMREGIEKHTNNHNTGNDIYWFEVHSDYHGYTQDVTAIKSYQKLWDSINKKTPWKSNPWVWRIEFELTEKQGMERVK